MKRPPDYRRIFTNSIVVHEGPSPVDGKPIVVIATGLVTPSTNQKTGPMVQVWIMRSDMPPREALHSGQDVSVCNVGKARCSFAGQLVDGKATERGCYVVMHQAVSRIYQSYNLGSYPKLSELRDGAFEGCKVRLGAYGNASIVPLEILETMATTSEGLTGYTQDWRDCDPRYARYLMASVTSKAEAREAQARGWRTFRVTALHPFDDREVGEVVCPATAEWAEKTGFKSDCHTCGMCDGMLSGKRPNIVEPAHGSAHTKRHALRIVDSSGTRSSASMSSL